MNQSSTNWTLTEYIHKYAVEDKNASYVFLEWAIKTYSSRLGQRLIISICADLPGMGYDNGKLKNGQFDVDFTKAEEIKGCLDYVANVAGVVRKMTGRTEYVLVAIFWLYRHSEVNIKRLEQVLGNVVLEAQVNNISIGNTKQALQMLDNAYNHNLKAKERLRFVPMYEDYLIKNYAWYETKHLKSKRG